MLFVSVPKVIEGDCGFLAQIRQRRQFAKAAMDHGSLLEGEADEMSRVTSS